MTIVGIIILAILGVIVIGRIKKTLGQLGPLCLIGLVFLYAWSDKIFGLIELFAPLKSVPAFILLAITIFAFYRFFRHRRRFRELFPDRPTSAKRRIGL